MSRRFAFVALCLLLAALLAATAWSQQQEPPGKYTLSLTTRTQLPMFEMPAMPNMPDLSQIPAGPARDALMKMLDPSKATRGINGEAEYPNHAVAPIFVTVPKDLALKSNKLVLEVPKWITDPVTNDQPDQPAAAVEMPPSNFTSKLYWHPDTAEGPKTSEFSFKGGKLPAGQARAGDVPGNEDYLERWSRTATGSEGNLPEKVVGHGNYVLNTGGITMPLDGFLPPLKVTAPKSLKEVKFAEGFKVVWEPVAGARGYILHAHSMISDRPMFAPPGAAAAPKSDKPVNTTIIQWVSTLHEPPSRVLSGYEQDTTIQDDLDNGVLLPGDATSCVVPPNVFPEDPGMFTLTVTAVGNDFYSHDNGITAFGKIRAEWSATHMPGMPGMDGMGGEGGMPDMGGDQTDQ